MTIFNGNGFWANRIPFFGLWAWLWRRFPEAMRERLATSYIDTRSDMHVIRRGDGRGPYNPNPHGAWYAIYSFEDLTVELPEEDPFFLKKHDMLNISGRPGKIITLWTYQSDLKGTRS